LALQHTASGAKRPAQGLKQVNEDVHQSTEPVAREECGQCLQWSAPWVKIATN
jgi:hypothetical protein